MRSAFRQWSMRGYQMKKRGLQLMEAEDMVINRYKGRHFHVWLRAYKRKKAKRKALYRFVFFYVLCVKQMYSMSYVNCLCFNARFLLQNDTMYQGESPHSVGARLQTMERRCRV